MQNHDSDSKKDAIYWKQQTDSKNFEIEELKSEVKKLTKENERLRERNRELCKKINEMAGVPF